MLYSQHMLGNMKFISCVDQDMLQASEKNLLYSPLLFQAFLYYSVYYTKKITSLPPNNIEAQC